MSLMDGMGPSESQNGNENPKQVDASLKVSSVNLSSKEITVRKMQFNQEDLIELEVYRDQEIDSLVEAGFIAEQDRWNEELRHRIDFHYAEVTLTVYTGAEYPVRSLKHEVTNISLPTRTVDGLRVSLRSICEQVNETNNYENWSKRDGSGYDASANMLVLDLAQTTRNHLEDYRCSKPRPFQRSDYHMSYERRYLLQKFYGYRGLLDHRYVESDEASEEELEAAARKGFDPFNPDGRRSIKERTQDQALKIHETDGEEEILNNVFGLDTSSISGQETVNNILGRTPSDIANTIPKEFRVLHIENVVRSECVRRFWNAQSHIKQDLSQLSVGALRQCIRVDRTFMLGKRGFDKEVLINIITEPEITFHGTEEQHVPSIVQHGFLKPGSQGNVRCGSTYGMGIYSSRDPLFALRYSPIRAQSRTAAGDFGGLKLIVCAVIIGRAASVHRDGGAWCESTTPSSGAHCHIGNNGLELVAFDSAQILPCYVVHLDLGLDACKYLRQLETPDTEKWKRIWEARLRTLWAKPTDTKLTGHEAPGDRRRIKETLTSQVRKNLPYGYGAASGHKFQILEVGEISEDEEEYGLYQEHRVENLEPSASFNFWDDDEEYLNLDLEDMSVGPKLLLGDVEDTMTKSGPSKVHAAEMKKEKFVVDLSGRAKFDKYYDARVAKNKKTLKTLDQLSVTRDNLIQMPYSVPQK